MSDGPHRSLPMPARWKRFAERVYNPAFSPTEMPDALTDAMIGDFREELPSSFVRRVGKTLFDDLPNIFGDQTPRFETLRGDAAGSWLACVFLDAVAKATETHPVDKALAEAALQTIRHLEARRARQIEEHYLREAKSYPGLDVRKRIERAFNELDETTIARGLVGGDEGEPRQKSTKQLGLDDGVTL